MSAAALAFALLAFGPPPQTTDEVVVLRFDAAKAKPKVSLSSHLAGDPWDLVGAAVALDAKVGSTVGKSPLRFAFAADWDGEGTDELILVREKVKKDGRLDLVVLRAPETGGTSTGKKVASVKKGDLGQTAGDGRVVAIGAADVDGDGIDELLIGRAYDDGRTTLELRALPNHKKAPLGEVLASDLDVAPSSAHVLIAVAGVNHDGAPGDALAFLWRADDGSTSLRVVAPPAAVAGAVGAPLSLDDDLALEGGSPHALSRLDFDDDGVDELLVRSTTPMGADRLDVFTASFASDVGDPVAWDASLAIPTFDAPLLAAFALRRAPVPPAPTGWTPPYPGWPANPWSFSALYTYPHGDVVTTASWGDVTTVSIDPIGAAGQHRMIFPNGAFVDLTLPGAPTGPVTLAPVYVKCPFPLPPPTQGTLQVTFPTTATLYTSYGVTHIIGPWVTGPPPPNPPNIGVVSFSGSPPFTFNRFHLEKL